MKMNLPEFRGYLNDYKIYKPGEILDVLKIVRKNFRFSSINKKVKYFNVPCSFDIETSSFYSGQPENKKVAIIGGGVGCAIAFPVAKKLSSLGCEVHSIFGFRNKCSRKRNIKY